MEKITETKVDEVPLNNKVFDINTQIIQNKIKSRRRVLSKNSNNVRFYSCKLASFLKLKSKETFSQVSIASALKTIKSFLNDINYNKANTTFMQQLFSFYKEFKERKSSNNKKRIIFDSKILVNIIESNPKRSISIKELAHEYKTITNYKKFSHATLTLWLKKNLNYAFTQIKLINTKRSTIDSKIMMIVFLEKLSALIKEDAILLSLDEASFCERKLRIKGWISNKYSMARESGGRTSSVSVIGVIDLQELLMYKLNKKTNSSKDFIIFIKELEEALSKIPKYFHKLQDQKVYLMCDNARIHTSEESRRELVNSKLRFVFIPTYSPNVQPIELLWARLKKVMSKKVIMNE